MTSELLTKSASELAALIRSRQVSARQVVDTHIARIEEVNPMLNAMVADRFAAARVEADTADKNLAAGEQNLPSFYGVPCTIKECFEVVGMPNSTGLIARKHVRGMSNATAVARLSQAGAIVLGVTNTSELCMWMESNNKLYGRTNNPYDPTRIVGGSSGGEGALVGSGASPFGLGSDIGGSIRMPAFFNGVFGHKPSGGLVPGSGQYPPAKGAALRYLTTGPLCRKAQDLWPLLTLLAGPDGIDTGCQSYQLGDPAHVAVHKLNVLNVPWNGRLAVAADLQAAQSKVADHLATIGAKVRYQHFDELEHSFAIWSAMLGAAQGKSSFRRAMQKDSIWALWSEVFKSLFGASEHTIPALALGLIENLGAFTPKRTARAIEAGKALKQKLETALGDNGVMLFPSHTVTAPKHNQPVYKLSFDWVYTAIFNVLELPVTQVPLGLNAEGLPLGIQVVAKQGNDHLTIAVALELERAFGGWVPPWTVKADA